jgi:hypothetical protein
MRIRDALKDARYQRQQIFERIAARDQDDYAKRAPDEILLELEILIRGEKYLEPLCRRASQQLSVPEPRPALLLDRANVMARELLRQLPR